MTFFCSLQLRLQKVKISEHSDNFQPFEVVGRSSETQLQVAEMCNFNEIKRNSNNYCSFRNNYVYDILQ